MKNKFIRFLAYFCLLGAIMMITEDIRGCLFYLIISIICFKYTGSFKFRKKQDKMNHKENTILKNTKNSIEEIKENTENTALIGNNNSNVWLSIKPPDIINGNKILTLYRDNNIKEFVDDYVIFDLETTGFDPYKNKIIEIGALKYKNNELIDSFNVLINPEVPIPKKITELTGIKTIMIKECNTIDIELKNFIDFIEDYTLIAHNASFDLGFIEANINNLNFKIIKNKNIDTLYLARKYIKNVENHKLTTLKKYFKLRNRSHRALDDCYVTNHLYQYCKKANADK